MKKFSNLALFFVIISAIVIIVGCTTYKINISKVSNKTETITFEVKKGQTFSTIGKSLKDHHLIRSEFFYKLYIKLYQVTGLEAGIYQLSENMGVEKIVEVFKKGTTYNPDAVTITFQEGLNMRGIASIIATKTNHKEDELYTLLKNTSYLDSLISKYWFLTDEIKNNSIYYSLEGYLFPDTYQFQNPDVSLEEIIKAMLDHMEKKLAPYQEKIKTKSYSFHEILTLASIIELEAPSKETRAGVAGVFYNRLSKKWSLGSDVTTYYAARIDIGQRDLYQSELNDYNAYNTRSSKMAGKLPVSPICNPSLESIQAALQPEQNDYLYFVADKNKKIYFSKTDTEHTKTVATLKSEGLWYEY